MHSGSKTLAGLCLVAVTMILILPNAAATTYTVNASPYAATHTLSAYDLWDSYELTAPSGAHIT